LKLVASTQYTSFPPRLPDQPIFYPVMNFEYAEQIARDWNTKSNSFAGFVTQFEIDGEYAKQFPVQVVGGRQNEELWVPAEELEEFNRRRTCRRRLNINSEMCCTGSWYNELRRLLWKRL